MRNGEKKVKTKSVPVLKPYFFSIMLEKKAYSFSNICPYPERTGILFRRIGQCPSHDF